MAYRTDLSNVQQMILALMPIPTAMLSVSASFTIIVLVCRSNVTPYKRILIGLSISDILLTFALTTAPILVPSESSIMLSRIQGNQATCSLSGVLSQMGVISNSFYSSFLALYFFCTVRLGWPPSRFSRVLEPAVHSIIAIVVVLSSAISLGLKVFQEAETGPGCWIAKEHLLLGLYFMAIISLACATIIAANVSIYLHVRSLTEKSLRRSMNPSVASNRKRLVAAQSFCYVAAYAVTYTPLFIMGLHHNTGGLLFRSKTLYFMFDLLYIVLLPLTGFLNLMVFLRPKYLQFREQHPDQSKWRSFQLSLSNAFTETRRRQTKFQAQVVTIQDDTPGVQQVYERDVEIDSTNPTDHSDCAAFHK